MTTEELNKLGQILDTTFGRSSSNDGSRSIKTSLAGNVLIIKYMTVVNFSSSQGLRVQIAKYEEEAIKMINSYMKKVKSDFKSSSGRTLKSKNAGGGDNVEMIQSTALTDRKVAYYRVNRTFEIS
jgi:hypothetical protein